MLTLFDRRCKAGYTKLKAEEKIEHIKKNPESLIEQQRKNIKEYNGELSEIDTSIISERRVKDKIYDSVIVLKK